MVNFRIPSLPGEPLRAALVDNFWTVDPKGAASFECPPNGRKLFVSYANGDYFRCEFDVIEDRDQLAKKLPKLKHVSSYPFGFPFTMVKIEQELSGIYPKFSQEYMDTGKITIGDTVMNASVIRIAT
ncbi:MULTISPECIES: hypothetical protein [Arthrobacter]|uniref:Uncharacterized protein n=1 Tax=Arthrobacter terricola TaxID=2547396 RepID=A0A4R5L183_9MICC|nr:MULTISPECIES: hypothetical protein [Arthrobacter]MBT8159607.1 hypothetical protein [Arthrobacter sp. GN70]TDG01276.1 hypothetical protein E1809_01780 [Arthrobacter terricola]